MKKHLKNILITNDDGYDAIGMKHLVEVLKPIANIVVVAPSNNKSACAHSMTLNTFLKFKEIRKDWYKLEDGTPTDCVFLGLHNLYKDKLPDLVISGINIGSNMGEDTTYSGTVAGAMEAVLQNVPAISISQVFDDDAKILGDDFDYLLAKKTILDIVTKILDGKFPLGERKLLNINIPPCSIKQCNGINITKVGSRIYGSDCQKDKDPRGNTLHWIGLHPLLWNESQNKDCDFEAIKQNKISITPIQLDMTSYDDIENLKQWIK